MFQFDILQHYLSKIIIIIITYCNNLQFQGYYFKLITIKEFKS